MICTLSPYRRATLALYTGALFIACSPILVRLSPLPPTATAFYRLFLAIPLLLLWVLVDARAGRVARMDGQTGYLWLLLAGVLFAGDLAVWHWSITLTSVANATLLANLAPVLVTLLAWLTLGEQPDRRFILGLLLSIVGVTLLLGTSGRMSGHPLQGDLLGILTAVFYGSYIVTIKHLRTTLAASQLLLGVAVVSSAVLLPVTIVAGEPLLPEVAGDWGVLVALAWISQVLGQGLIVYALAHLRASLSSVVLLLQPVLAAVFAAVLFGEFPGPVPAMGAGVVLAGIWLAQRSRVRT